MAIELAAIFQRYGARYRARFADRLLPSHREAMAAITDCRTAVMGGHLYDCPQCEQTLYSYHSCQNRHCPKCQFQAGEEWLERQQARLLPTPAFLLTFTLPASLRPILRQHQKLGYNLLFRTAAAATQQLAQDPRFVGGQLGMIGVLHTWGRNLSYHPHVHFIVPAGGLDAGGSWCPARHNFLVPVRALSLLFRAKFRDALKKTAWFALVPAECWQQAWVVHCKPVGDGVAALRYLAPYIFRVALSNRRILKVAGGRVTFRYRASDTGRLRTCTLATDEFIRRFLQHVLPKGFVKVRYFGLYSPAYRQRLAQLLLQLGKVPSVATTESDEQTTKAARGQPLERTLPCPHCGQPLRWRQRLRPRARCPPSSA